MIRVIILEKNIYDDLWLELILVIIYIKNNQLIKAIQNCISPHKVCIYKPSTSPPPNI